MTDSPENEPAQRLDKWLWFSRVLKSRTLAAQLVAEGGVRVNRVRITKPSHSVRAGDVLTVAVRGRVLVLRILAAGERRGPVTEARSLYEVLNGPAGHGAATAQGRDPDLESAAKDRG
jgi:ribosome-associated heat shock protein Hsp15